jgi:hypothetical protein
MAKSKKDDIVLEAENTKTVTPNSPEWTDHVLNLLTEDEKINGNPTTDGLRRIFEKALNCTIISAEPEVVQSPTIDNERRATVVYSIGYVLNDEPNDSQIKYRSVAGAADVYWGNCDKIFRNHPVAVAETRAEGRALRKGLKLRKVVTADEIAKDIDTDHLEQNNIGKINNTQINFVDVFGKRLNINITKLLDSLAIDSKNIYNIVYDDAVKIITTLSEYQHSNNIPENIVGYEPNWK